MELFKRNSKVFGIPLSEVFQNEFGIPRILVETISVLEQGIFFFSFHFFFINFC